MARFSEEQLKNWYKPVSDTENEKINHAIAMIKSAIKNSEDFNSLTYDIFVQGSYGNTTNVKLNSDVDVNIMLTSTFFSCYPDGKNEDDYGFVPGTISYLEYKNRVVKALQKQFGIENVKLGNKSIKIASNSYRVNADCVVSMQYRNYKITNSINPNKYVEGIKYYAKDGTEVINYPREHIKNGTSKNVETNYKYKKLVRIFKHVRNEMCDDAIISKDKITSFLVECLVWNVPNKTITGFSTWNETVKQSIIYLYKTIKNDGCSQWKEVSELIYLFHLERKWSKFDVEDFLLKIWVYMGYEDESH